MDRTPVSPGIFPPIISTTPNSPTVCANPRTAAVTKPERANGTATVKKRSSFDAPKLQLLPKIDF